jgi:VanZ family protein
MASAFGASDEFHQAFVPGRTADVADWMADTLGAAIGALVATFALRRPGRAG